MYSPETYWDEVASNISQRNGSNIIAGDDEPYYEYKRKRLVELFKKISVTNKNILEFGCGPGGNLLYFSLAGANASGVDISENMLQIARQRLKGHSVNLQKINNHLLPFNDNAFDIVFTVTVLQHNTNELELRKILHEIGRVCNKDLYLFERIEKRIKGHESNTGRPVSYYEQILLQEGYKLTEVKFMQLQASYFVCGLLRKVFSSKTKKEGEPLNKAGIFLQKILLPITSLIDLVTPSKRDVAKLHFQKDTLL